MSNRGISSLVSSASVPSHSVFFVLPPLSLDSIILVNFNRQAACLCKDPLVLYSLPSRSRVLFRFNVYT